MRVYVSAPDHEVRQARMGTKLRGRIAVYALLVEQRRYSGGDLDYAQEELERARADKEAFSEAPSGTAFLYRKGATQGDIWVVRADGSEAYFGPADGYAEPSA